MLVKREQVMIDSQEEPIYKSQDWINPNIGGQDGYKCNDRHYQAWEKEQVLATKRWVT